MSLSLQFNLVKVVSWTLLLTITITNATITASGKANKDSGKVLENRKLNSTSLSNTGRAVPDDICEGEDPFGPSCEPRKLLICENGTLCACAKFTHEEILSIFQDPQFPGFEIQLPPGARFSINTIWKEGKGKCVGLKDSLCPLGFLEDNLPYVDKVECDDGLRCRPYPDKELKDFLGKCKAPVLSMSITLTSFVATMSLVLHRYTYC